MTLRLLVFEVLTIDFVTEVTWDKLEQSMSGLDFCEFVGGRERTYLYDEF